MWILTIWVRWKEPKNPDFPLEGLCTDSLTATHPGRWQRVNSSGGIRDMGKD